MKRKVVMGADSAGYTLKEELKKHLEKNGFSVTDCGTNSSESCHYPIFAGKVCEEVLRDADNTFGVLICGTGIGMSMCANKYNGIRAALCSDTYSARMSRAHNDANVICLGARVIGPCLAEEILDTFLAESSVYEGGRHAIRVGMIRDIEEKQKNKPV